jgi:iron only hydrogenase large subunit-like protein
VISSARVLPKKAKFSGQSINGIVDCVLTFTELKQWFEQEKIDLNNCEQSLFDAWCREGQGYFHFRREIRTHEKKAQICLSRKSSA